MRDEEPSEYAEHRKVVDLGWAKTMDLIYSKSNGWQLELELIQTHMTQKPVLRVEVGARALRVLIKNAAGQEGQVRAGLLCAGWFVHELLLWLWAFETDNPGWPSALSALCEGN
jgi:hypothetical protein